MRHPWTVGGRELSQPSPAEVFTQAAKSLFGDHFAAPLGHALNVDKAIVSKWAAGKSRIPQGVWTEVAGLMQDQFADWSSIRVAVLAMTEPPAATIMVSLTEVRSRMRAAAGSTPILMEDVKERFEGWAQTAGFEGVQLSFGQVGYVIALRQRVDDATTEGFKARLAHEIERLSNGR